MTARVGWCTSARFLEHAEPGHPERPERLSRLLEVVNERGILEGTAPIEPRPVAADLLGRVHAADQIERVRALSDAGGGRIDGDTYVSAGSDGIARLAAGALVDCVDAILDGTLDRAFAAVRPPGHHATAAHSMGFCLYNNVAIGARHARERGVERVAIVDWDVHHGNGTQDIFYEDGDVLFVSTHQWPLYPGTGRAEETGRGAGKGATVNVPLPAGTGDRGLAEVFDSIVGPVLRRHAPDLIFVSAGFDPHARDPLAAFELTVDGFRAIADAMVALADELAGGRLVVCLEGGYDLEAMGYGGGATLAAMCGRPHDLPPLDGEPTGTTRQPDVSAVIGAVRVIQGLAA